MIFPKFTKFVSSRVWFQIQVFLTSDLEWLPFLRAGLYILHISLSPLHYSLSWVSAMLEHQGWQALDVPWFNLLTVQVGMGWEREGLCSDSHRGQGQHRGWLNFSSKCSLLTGHIALNAHFIYFAGWSFWCNYGSIIFLLFLGKSWLNPESSPLVPLLFFWLFVFSIWCVKPLLFHAVNSSVVWDNGDSKINQSWFMNFKNLPISRRAKQERSLL